MLSPTPRMLERAAATQAQKDKEHRAAAEQADKDARVKSKGPEMDLKPGDTPTLHQLNHMAKATDRRLKDTARDAAIASAKAVEGVLRAAGGGTTAGIARRYGAAGGEVPEIVPPGAKEAKLKKGGRKRAAPAER